MWKSFKEVRIGASIDGYGDVLNYQRFSQSNGNKQKRIWIS